MGNAAAIAAAFGGGLPPGISGTNDRCTILVSNLNEDVSCSHRTFVASNCCCWSVRLWLTFLFGHEYQKIDEDKLFNLFSLYGNIVRIKMLRNKPDHALIQMGDGFQAELAVHFLKVWPLISRPTSSFVIQAQFVCSFHPLGIYSILWNELVTNAWRSHVSWIVSLLVKGVELIVPLLIKGVES